MTKLLTFALTVMLGMVLVAAALAVPKEKPRRPAASH